jgi:hypothetical protein
MCRKRSRERKERGRSRERDGGRRKIALAGGGGRMAAGACWGHYLGGKGVREGRSTSLAAAAAAGREGVWTCASAAFLWKAPTCGCVDKGGRARKKGTARCQLSPFAQVQCCHRWWWSCVSCELCTDCRRLR